MNEGKFLRAVELGLQNWVDDHQHKPMFELRKHGPYVRLYYIEARKREAGARWFNITMGLPVTEARRLLTEETEALQVLAAEVYAQRFYYGE